LFRVDYRLSRNITGKSITSTRPEIEQYIVEERFNNAVGSVEGAICSVAEMGMYLMSMVLSDPSDFGCQVGVSATAVSFGGVCFGAFLCMYHMHPHHHHDHDAECRAEGENVKKLTS